jgi:hypothetical protein
MNDPIDSPKGGDTRSALRAAWDDLIGELQRARDAIDQPDLMPPPPNDRNLAEGYRYLMGFVHSGVERAFFEDPQFPFVRHALQLINKGTIDNADAIYFMAPIDGRESYLLRGQVADHRHWRGEAPATAGRLAPQYLIFELSDGCIAGDSGSLTELRPGAKVQTGKLDSSQIEVDERGCFEILLAPERPAAHTGNFIATLKRSKRPEHPDRYACWLSGRQLFCDWEREDPAPLTLEQVGTDGCHPRPYDADTAATQLRRMGSLVRGQMHFWNEFNTILLETYGKRDGGGGEAFMPRNAFNRPNAASRETGGGQSTNIYAGGVFELEPDEALIVESRVAVEPQYSGFHLANLWGESLDFANHQSSLNGCQSDVDADGVRRLVIAHNDPGIANWIDSTGHREGYMAARWAYSTQPPQDQWPVISATKIRFDEIRRHLPPSVREVSPLQRADAIRIRREHVQRRYRVF